MINLLLDSSNASLAVGLALDHKIIDSVTYEAWQKQSEYMVDEIDKLLKKNHYSRTDLGGVVVCKGPGSYTGVRIALTIGKVTANILGLPLYLVSSLEALKDVNGKTTICLSNARSKRSYIGVYEGEKCLLEDTIMSNEEVLQYIKDHPSYLVSGDCEYLGLDIKINDVLKVLVNEDNPLHLCGEPLAAKPVYLKDAYPV
jgi:tRNA threonylcarbamoyladenosine biosynthesis protein TsaB